MDGGIKPITIVPFENVGGQTTLMCATKGGSFNNSIYFPEAFLLWGIMTGKNLLSPPVNSSRTAPCEIGENKLLYQ